MRNIRTISIIELVRILLLSDINSPHTIKWAVGLAKSGIHVGVFSFHKHAWQWNESHKNIVIFNQIVADDGTEQKNLLSKFSYLKSHSYLKEVIHEFQPDIVHAHYASSYGLLGALCGFNPFFISAWGSDVMRFPQSGILQRWIVRFNLRRAAKIFATSKALQNTLSQLGFRSTVIPFGIDINIFSPIRNTELFSENELVIGTIKSLQPLYRTEWIVKAFALVQQQRTDLPLRLLVVGGGTQEAELKQLARQFCANGTFHFTGRIDYSRIPAMHQQLDIFAHAAVNESFGVSTLEASACGKPVVACKSGGASEVAINEQTALLYEENDFDQLVSHLHRLVEDASLRKKLGNNGRQFVCENFDWNKNMNLMIDEYQQQIKKKQ